jgi:phospholipase/carboxylesterase
MPSTERKYDACILWLHGDGESGSSWTRLESDPMQGLGNRLPWAQWAFPDAPGGAWFDVEYPVFDAAKEPPRLDDAVIAIHKMLTEIEATGIKTSRILLAGFGPGAALALLAGRTYPHTLAGLIGISGWLMKPKLPSSEKAARTPVLLCHGDDDDEVPIEHYHSACARLQRDGHELTCFRYDGFGHRQCAEELTVLAAPKNFITDKLRTLTQVAPVPREVAAARMKALAATADAAASDVPVCKLDAPRPPASCSLVSMSEEADNELRIVLALEGLTSLAQADLNVGETELSLTLPGARAPFVLRFPRPVDAAAAERPAKYSKKTGELRLSLTLA